MALPAARERHAKNVWHIALMYKKTRIFYFFYISKFIFELEYIFEWQNLKKK